MIAQDIWVTFGVCKNETFFMLSGKKEVEGKVPHYPSVCLIGCSS